jgi:outer membrane protein assembly factor BamC
LRPDLIFKETQVKTLKIRTDLLASVSLAKKSLTPSLTLVCAALVLSGCTSVGNLMEGQRVDYKTEGKSTAPSLEIPPDLTQLSKDNRYVVPGAVVTASGMQVGQVKTAIPIAALSVGDVRIERSGNQRWLVIDRPADKLWSPVRDFWLENGFLLTLDQENLGIMETDYAENRAKLPQDFIRQTIGKVFDSLYSTGERDKFRTRLERNAAGGTEIYISHRGLIEVVTGATTGNKLGDSTVWQPRPADEELEAEFLRRMMVKLGVSKDQSAALVAAQSARSTSRIASINGLPVVQMDDTFDRAWRRVGLALDRTGFTVEDRDRSQGTYFVRYVDPTTTNQEQGFFSKIFSAVKPAVAPLQYRISVKSVDQATTVSVLNDKGAPETSGNAKRIIQVIADDLK